MKAKYFQVLVENGVEGFILRATGAGDPNIAKETDEYENLRSAFEYLQEKQIPIVVTTQAPDGLASMKINEPRTNGIESRSHSCLGYEHRKYGYKIILAVGKWIFLSRNTKRNGYIVEGRNRDRLK